MDERNKQTEIAMRRVDQAFKQIESVKEQVSHPSHYGGDSVYEVIKVLEARLSHEQFIGFLRGNALKYLFRAGVKTATSDEDLKKAEFYTKYEIDYMRRKAYGFVGEGRAEMRMPLLLKEDNQDA